MEPLLSGSKRRVLLFLLISLVVCALVNPGNFGAIDTTWRLQVERWMRLGAPPVRAVDTEFGIIGRNGVRHAWFGMGQSLVLAPIDAVVSAAVVPILVHFGLDSQKQQQVLELLIAFVMQSLITFCSLVIAYEVLMSFKFSPKASISGALALLFGSMYLQYVQCAQENNLLLLLALSALLAIRRWREEGRMGWPVLAGAACGFAILTRLTSVLETTIFLLLAFALGGRRMQFALGYLGPVGAALVLDRWYHWHRFGELFSTYMSIFGRQRRPTGAPADFPFSYPFWKGFWGTFFDRDKSIFLFDPLLVVLLLIAIWRWRDIRGAVRLTLLWAGILLLAYAGFYARYFNFGGDAAWGHRFVTLPVQLLCLFAVPLLVDLGATLPVLLRRTAWTIVCGSVILQAASTVVSPNLEIYQREMNYGGSVITNRLANLAEISRTGAARPITGVPLEWRTLNYFPFQLRFRYSALASWAITLWAVLAACLPLLVLAAIRNATFDKRRVEPERLPARTYTP